MDPCNYGNRIVALNLSGTLSMGGEANARVSKRATLTIEPGLMVASCPCAISSPSTSVAPGDNRRR